MKLEKENSYDKWWLSKDMENMGYIFEFCNNYCLEMFNVDIDKLKFLNAFMKSNIRYEMETGHQRLLSQSGRDSVKMFINVDCDGNAEQFKKDKNSVKTNYAIDQFYWVGWMYAYLHYEEDILSRDLVDILTLDDMLNRYYRCGHEMDVTVFHKHVKDAFKNSEK